MKASRGKKRKRKQSSTSVLRGARQSVFIVDEASFLDAQAFWYYGICTSRGVRDWYTAMMFMY
jgi:hypothetical protein